MAKKTPPEKIYEAWSALASGRLELAADASAAAGEAAVRSSNGEKTYHVSWRGPVFSSDDNASWWQGYPGYPVIATMMKLGLLPLDETAARLFADVDWNAANKRAKGDYAKALREVEDGLGLDQTQREQAAHAASLAFEALEKLEFVMKRPARKRKPQAKEQPQDANNKKLSGEEVEAGGADDAG